ncbi:hypothetical protein C8R46DRAFT_1212438 [Mycena filopes]|nr:hypothetical protein C8R46DRAFT_1212438 [Mycena filopes]
MVSLKRHSEDLEELQECGDRKRHRGHQQPIIARITVQPRVAITRSAAEATELEGSDSDSEPDEETRQLDKSITKERAKAIADVKRILQLLDENTIEELHRNLCAHKFGWSLDPVLNLPFCKCQLCDTYLAHVRSSADQEDYAPDGMDEDWVGQCRFKSGLMQKLFLIRDLEARVAAFKYSHEDPRGSGELQGSLVNAHAELLKLRADLDTALARQAVLQREAEASETTHQDLKSQREELSGQLQTARVAQNEAACALGIAQNEIEALRRANAQLSKERDEALLENARSAAVAQTEGARQQLDETRAFKSTADGYWLTMKMPSRDQPIQTFARWIQFHRLPILGIVFHDPDCTLDMRDLRGHREVQSRLPAKHSRDGSAQRKLRRQAELEIVSLLAVPEKYSLLLRQTNTPISPFVSYLPLSPPPLNDEHVAKLLAAQGMTPAVANNAQQYAYNFIMSAAASGDTQYIQVKAGLAHVGKSFAPPGLNSAEVDRFPRPADLPRNQKSK